MRGSDRRCEHALGSARSSAEKRSAARHGCSQSPPSLTPHDAHEVTQPRHGGRQEPEENPKRIRRELAHDKVDLWVCIWARELVKRCALRRPRWLSLWTTGQQKMLNQRACEPLTDWLEQKRTHGLGRSAHYTVGMAWIARVRRVHACVQGKKDRPLARRAQNRYVQQGKAHHSETFSSCCLHELLHATLGLAIARCLL